MLIHSETSTEFVGLRQGSGGRKQVICETFADGRVVLNIGCASTDEMEVEDAMREAVKSRNMMCGLLKALSQRGIEYDVAN